MRRKGGEEGIKNFTQCIVITFMVTSTVQQVRQSTPLSLPFKTVRVKIFANDTNCATIEATSVRLATWCKREAFQSILIPLPTLLFIRGLTNRIVMYILKSY